MAALPRMKPLAIVLFLCLIIGLSPRAGRAQDSVPAPLAVAITQLDTDLLAIPAGSTVTDAQHQAIVVDLDALAVGITPAPDPADVDAAATTLGSAAVAGNVTADTLAELNTDLAADATDADDWLDDVTADATDLLSPDVDPTDPTDPGIGDDPQPPTGTAVPVFVTATSARPRRTHQYHNFDLDVQNGQSPSNQFYYGVVALDTRQTAGSAPVSTILVRAVGLPRSNPYTVTITRKSDGAAVTVGRFNVQDVSSRTFNLYLTADIPDDYDENVENLTVGQTTFGGGNPKKALPAGFDARDVASVSLTDTLGVARLSGHPATGVGNYRTRGVVLHLYGDATAAPAASAVAKADTVGGIANTFYLSARHLPASTAVTLVADGVAVGQFTTGAHGRLLVAEGNVPAQYNRAGVRLSPQMLPKTLNLSETRSLMLTDAQGGVLLSSDVTP